MKKHFTLSFLVLFTLAFNYIASAKPLGDLPNNMTFDVNKFENYLRSKLDGNAVGYVFVVNQNGKFLRQGNYGYSVLKKDEPKILSPIGESLMPQTRMNIASVTKPITATAVLKALQNDPNITVDSKIAPFLPTNWTLGPGVKDLTFKELMSQYSGMFDNKGDTSIAGLRNWIKSGVTRSKTNYIYINGNLAIFRIALPYMLASDAKRKEWNNLAKSDEAKFNTEISNRFKEIVRELVFIPMGIKNVDMKDGSEMPTRLYNNGNNAAGYVVGDWTESGGGGGWFMSAIELAQFMAHLRYNDKILNSSTRKIMDDSFLGWEDPAAFKQFQGKYGDYLGHGGLLKYNDASPSTIVGMNSIVANFPSGVQAVILINSFGNYPNKQQLISDAFDAAVVLKQQIKAN
jgi:CubicO group peptidase (beta-lactamase class C family)